MSPFLLPRVPIWSPVGPNFDKFMSLENILNATLIVFQRHQLSTGHSLYDTIKGLKEVTRKLEEGDEIDSSRMGIVEKFLKNFPPPTKRSARNLSEFPAELLQLIFFLPTSL